MPVHRSSAFVVVREEHQSFGDPMGSEWQYHEVYRFSAIIGVYQSIQRAEEVAGAAAQALKDAGVPDDAYRFTVKASNYYDE